LETSFETSLGTSLEPKPYYNTKILDLLGAQEHAPWRGALLMRQPNRAMRILIR
jgi:hypothetical protein